MHQEDSTARVRIHKRLNTFFYSIFFFLSLFFCFVIHSLFCHSNAKKSEAKRMNERDVNTRNRRELRRRKNTTMKWRINQHTNKTVWSEEITHHTAAPATRSTKEPRASTDIHKTRLPWNTKSVEYRECKRIDNRENKTNSVRFNETDDDENRSLLRRMLSQNWV